MKKNKHKDVNDSYSLAYSTKAGYNPFESLSFLSEQNNDENVHKSCIVELHFQVKGRNGKPVTIVKNLSSDFDLEITTSTLKKLLNTGGSVKNGEIILQGDQRNEVSRWFASKNIKVKRVGG